MYILILIVFYGGKAVTSQVVSGFNNERDCKASMEIISNQIRSENNSTFGVSKSSSAFCIGPLTK